MSPLTLAPGIHVLPAFLETDSTARVLAQAPNMPWTKAYVGYYRDDALVEKKLNLAERDVEVARFEKPFSDLVPGYAEQVTQIVESLYGLRETLLDGFVMSKYSVGCHIRPHSDTGVRSTSRLVTVVQYFNSEYEGGLLGFPQFEVQYRPLAGDLVLFLSEYLHSVSQITSGVRYSMIAFAKAAAMLRLPKWSGEV